MLYWLQIFINSGTSRLIGKHKKKVKNKKCHSALWFFLLVNGKPKLHLSVEHHCSLLFWPVCRCTGFYMILTDVLRLENSKSTSLWLCQLSEYYSHQCPPIHFYMPLYIMYSNQQGHSKTQMITVVWRSSS